MQCDVYLTITGLGEGVVSIARVAVAHITASRPSNSTGEAVLGTLDHI